MDDRRKKPAKVKEITYHVGWKKGTIRPNRPSPFARKRPEGKLVVVKSTSSSTDAKPAASEPIEGAAELPTWTIPRRGRFVSVLPNAAWHRAPWLSERLVMPLLWIVPAVSFALTLIAVYLLMHYHL